MSENKIISKDSIQRLLRDVKDVIKNPLTSNGIYYVHDDEDMLKGYALIVGPEDTPYFGGYYLFEIKYPTDYPHSPPYVTYCTNGDNIRFNPNLYKCGKVCISILNTWRGEQWSSCQTISTVLLHLCTLLCVNPLVNEPGVSEKHKDCESYTKIIEYKNIEISLMQIYEKKSGVFLPQFEMFTSIIKDEFKKNYEKVSKFLETKKDEPECQLTIGYYNMSVGLNYPKLYSRWNEFVNKNKI